MQDAFDEIRARLERFESSLPRELDGYALSPLSKLPFKASLYRFTLIWRMTELARDALEAFQRDRIVSGILLTRAAMETAAALCYLCSQIKAAVTRGQVGDIDNHLTRLIMGTRIGAEPNDPPEEGDLARPIKISRFMTEMEEVIEDSNHTYGILSEYAHPNWAGTVLAYSKHENERGLCTCGRGLRGSNDKDLGLNMLSGSLLLFESYYIRLHTLVPAFISLCEASKDADSTKHE